ncbi:PilZ domain-containing protein, partial [Pseudomonas aeruginosa]
GATQFSLLSDLHLMGYESLHLVRPASERVRTLANYLQMMTKCTDLLGHVRLQSLRNANGSPRTVSLSEGGVILRDDRVLA